MRIHMHTFTKAILFLPCFCRKFCFASNFCVVHQRISAKQTLLHESSSQEFSCTSTSFATPSHPPAPLIESQIYIFWFLVSSSRKGTCLKEESLLDIKQTGVVTHPGIVDFHSSCFVSLAQGISQCSMTLTQT